MGDSECDVSSGNLNYSDDDLNAVSALLDACEKYPAVYKAVLKSLGPRTYGRDFTPTMIPTIRSAVQQGQASPVEGLENFSQPHSDPELGIPRLLAHVSADAKWIAGLIVGSKLGYADQKNFTWGKARVTKIIGKERVKNAIKELKVVLRGGLS